MTIDSIMHPATPSKAELLAAYDMTIAVLETIREAGEVPSGVLYAMLCAKMEFTAYESMIAMLKRTGLVEETGHLLRWVGPLKGETR